MSEQIELLANFIMASVDGEPSKSEGAGDCAIRIITDLQAECAALKKKVVTAYWRGHDCGRLWGMEAISREEIERGGIFIAALLKEPE